MDNKPDPVIPYQLKDEDLQIRLVELAKSINDKMSGVYPFLPPPKTSQEDPGVGSSMEQKRLPIPSQERTPPQSQGTPLQRASQQAETNYGPGLLLNTLFRGLGNSINARMEDKQQVPVPKKEDEKEGLLTKLFKSVFPLRQNPEDSPPQRKVGTRENPEDFRGAVLNEFFSRSLRNIISSISGQPLPQKPNNTRVDVPEKETEVTRSNTLREKAESTEIEKSNTLREKAESTEIEKPKPNTYNFKEEDPITLLGEIPRPYDLQPEEEKPKEPSSQEKMTDTSKMLDKLGEGLRGWGDMGNKLGGFLSSMGIGKQGDEIGKVANTVETAGRAVEGDPIAIAQLAKQAMDAIREKIDQFKKDMHQVGTDVHEAFGTDKFGETGAAITKTFGDLGKAMGGPGGHFVENISKFGEQVFRSIDRLRNWNEQLYQSNMRFSQFSSSMANVKAEQEVRDIYLEQRRGERLAGTARAQAESKHALEEKVSGYEDIWSNIKNSIDATINRVLAELIPSVAPPVKEEDRIDMNEWIKEVSATQWDQMWGRPDRF